MIKLPAKDGKPAITIEYHPSFHFPMHLLQRFTPKLRSQLDRKCAEYKQKKGGQMRQQNELQSIVYQQQAPIQQLQSHISSSAISLPPPPTSTIIPPPVPAQVQVSQASVASELSNPQNNYTTMMGGRN